MQRIYERVMLTISAGALALIAAHATLGSAAAAPSRIDELTVHRIRIVDRDGTLRAVFTGKPLPEAIIDGKRIAGPNGLRQDAGFIFYNDRGDE